MTKEEFFDKIDEIRIFVQDIVPLGNDEEDIKKAITLLNELKEDANQLLEEEYDAGYDLGLDRGWNHIDENEME